MLRCAVLRARSLQTHVERASTARALASSAASSQKSEDEDSLRKAAEARAAKKVYAGSSPLFSWTEVDISDADKHIPRWQNAVFVVVVGSFLAWFGNKLVTSELRRREKIEKERTALERRARDAIRAHMGTSAPLEFAHDDAFEGLTPDEIDALVASEREKDWSAPGVTTRREG
jgi:hypothetical protein